MDHKPIISELNRNKAVLRELLAGTSQEEYLWRSAPEKWNLLEIVCHLYDEEREDFRARTKHCLEIPGQAMPAIDPVGWVKERKYAEQDYNATLAKFLEERERSVEWLRSLKAPNWASAYQHPKMGPVSAWLILSNWLAHDHLHIRQIIRTKYLRLKELSGEKLDYAGEW